MKIVFTMLPLSLIASQQLESLVAKLSVIHLADREANS
jgi:hypothetical protein